VGEDLREVESNRRNFFRSPIILKTTTLRAMQVLIERRILISLTIFIILLISLSRYTAMF
jgi:hypothetical protein